MVCRGEVRAKCLSWCLHCISQPPRTESPDFISIFLVLCPRVLSGGTQQGYCDMSSSTVGQGDCLRGHLLMSVLRTQTQPKGLAFHPGRSGSLRSPSATHLGSKGRLVRTPFGKVMPPYNEDGHFF